MVEKADVLICGAGELIAAHIIGDDLPQHAPTFSPGRYFDTNLGKYFHQRAQTPLIRTPSKTHNAPDTNRREQ